ncbi:MAG: sensor histidine kinase, partial [Planctomycetes bacterium]|nr:sensor histidine kinase [Planctomycetota bacterium]
VREVEPARDPHQRAEARRAVAARDEVGDIGEVVIADLVEQAAQECLRRHDFGPEIFAFELDPDLVLDADPTSLRTIVSNLLDNAIKYSDGTPHVHVTSRRGADGRSVEIVVRDQGIGISKGDLKRIFQRFYRVPEEAVRARHGTGLGLFVVQALVRDLGGRIEAHSEGVGFGTTLRVSL